MRIESGTTKKFELAPHGSQPARLIHIIDLGTQAGEYKGVKKDKRKVRITFELVDAKMEDGRNFVIGGTYTASLYKSNLLNLIESMTGRAITFESDGSFNMGQLLDHPCMLSVLHETKDGKNYANIGSVSPMPTIKGKMLEADPSTNHLINFSLDPYDKDVFDMVPKWVQEIIKKSPEWEACNELNDSIPF